jgi:2-hydroxychromene-2-carboxylate isomerase
MRRLQFWFEFASTYSYVAAFRVERVAGAAGVTVDWKPFLLGPIFRGQGWSD